MSLIQRVAQQMDKADAFVNPPLPERTAKPPHPPAKADLPPQEPPHTVRRAAAAPKEPPRDANAAPGLAKSAETTFQLPCARLARRGIITPEDRHSRLAEEVRLIKHQLLRRMASKRKDGVDWPAQAIVMVTSAMPEEGKSSIALNLALSFAIDERLPAMLIDTDYVRSKNSDLLKLARAPGLTDALQSDAISLRAVTYVADDLPFRVVLPGSHVSSATDLYAGERMSACLSEAARANIVIIDTPPLLSTTEAIVLAPQAKEVVLVVEAERTTQAALQSALDLLEPCESVSLVLNKSERSSVERFGSYYIPPAASADSAA
jgi:protein-tyrosine kinase